MQASRPRHEEFDWRFLSARHLKIRPVGALMFRCIFSRVRATGELHSPDFRHDGHLSEFERSAGGSPATVLIIILIASDN